MLGLTPFQTIGPFFDVLLRSRVPNRQVTDAARGTPVVIEGVLYDGAHAPICDGFVETWQADAEGRYRHPEDRRQPADAGFSGYGWSATVDAGRFRFETIKPGIVVTPEWRAQAPHVLVSVMARGILTRHVTRVYFDDEAANQDDPILALVPRERHPTLVARRSAAGVYRFDIRVQGADETVFFDV